MKKILYIFLFLFLIFGVSLITSCGGDDNSTTTTTDIKSCTHQKEIVYGSDATCTKDGVTDGEKCSLCGEILKAQETIPAKGHTKVSVPAKAASCYATGLTEGEKCSLCNEIFKAQETVQKIEHTFVDGKCSSCGKSENESEGLEFKLSDDEKSYIVSGIGTCTDRELIIPDYYNGLPVSEIGAEAISYNKNIIKLVLGENIIKVKARAFEGCHNLLSVTVNAKLETIEDSAFSGTRIVEIYNLSSITMGKGATDNGLISANAGAVYSSLGTKTILFTKNDYIFAKYDGNTYLMLYYGDDRDLTLPRLEGNENYKLAFGAFQDTDITDITIPDCVTEIGFSCFAGCTYLKELVLPESITKTMEHAFADCHYLRSVTIPKSLKDIGFGTFTECVSLDTVKYNGTLDDWMKITFHSETSNPLSNGSKLYINNQLITEVTVSDEFERVNSYCFYGYKHLKKVIIPGTVDAIGEKAFEGCTGLYSVSLGEGVSSIESAAFKNCFSLSTIAIPSTVSILNVAPDIGVFAGCESLVELYNLPNLDTESGNFWLSEIFKVIHSDSSSASVVETVDDYIFATLDGKHYLMSYVGDDKEITLPADYHGEVYDIYPYAFYKDTDIEKVTFSDGVKIIGKYAFFECKSLRSVILPHSLEEIHESVFEECSTLLTITIPENVTLLKDRVFFNCIQLKEIYNLSELDLSKNSYLAGITYIGDAVIHNSLEDESIYDTVDGFIFMKHPDYVCTMLMDYVGADKNIALPESYNGESYHIYDYAIYNRDITSVTVSEGVKEIRVMSFYLCPLDEATFANKDGWKYDTSFEECIDLSSKTDSAAILCTRYLFEQLYYTVSE